jgi:hypothetical protein
MALWEIPVKLSALQRRSIKWRKPPAKIARQLKKHALSVTRRKPDERDFTVLELQDVFDDAVDELTFRRGGVRQAAETSQPSFRARKLHKPVVLDPRRFVRHEPKRGEP